MKLSIIIPSVNDPIAADVIDINMTPIMSIQRSFNGKILTFASDNILEDRKSMFFPR